MNLATNFSLAAWVKRNATGAFHAIYDLGEQANEWWIFITGLTSGGLNDNRLGFGERGIAEIYSTKQITDTNWHHIAVVKNGDAGNNVTFYVDGVASGSAAAGTVTTPSGPKQIGALLDGSFLAHFNGSLDDLRLYNRALTAAEVLRLAQGQGCITDGTTWTTAFRELQCGLAAARRRRPDLDRAGRLPAGGQRQRGFQFEKRRQPVRRISGAKPRRRRDGADPAPGFQPGCATERVERGCAGRRPASHLREL